MNMPEHSSHGCEIIGQRSVTESNYRTADDHVAHVLVGLATSNREESSMNTRNFTEYGFAAVDSGYQLFLR